MHHLTPGITGLNKNNCQMGRVTFKFWDLVPLIHCIRGLTVYSWMMISTVPGQRIYQHWKLPEALSHVHTAHSLALHLPQHTQLACLWHNKMSCLSGLLSNQVIPVGGNPGNLQYPWWNTSLLDTVDSPLVVLQSATVDSVWMPPKVLYEKYDIS